MSFWLPGTYGSLAAVPAQPGWSFATIYYHTSVDAGAGTSFVRGGGVEAGIKASGDLQMFAPNYVFATPVLGGQAALGMTGFFGRSPATIAGSVTGPLGNTISGSRTDSVTSFGDLYPTASLRWNQGSDNFMTYVSGDVPVGSYNSQRLANIGIGHGAVDAGGGYTYLNMQTGHEFSAVMGLTYNLINPSTHYQNGIDFHLDWGLSQFLSEHIEVGAVGYVYQQLTGDSGSGARLGGFKSRVDGMGPQLGLLFPAGDMQGYLNIRGYKEFNAQNRPAGWNVWVTLSFSPGEPTTAQKNPVAEKN